MRIEILSVTNNEIPGKKAGTSYNQLELAFKNHDSGKVEGKKAVSFGDWAPAYSILKESKPGEFYSVEPQKIGDFWVWTNVQKVNAEQQQNTPAKTTPAPRSTYETAEERAARQVLIVRQSSLTAALSYLELTGNKKASVEDVEALANRFVEFVFNRETPTANAVNPDFSDFKDDIPY